tara:strand:+ start:14697 stop:15065 length:369 start_codon:yes stop_codon:yes gene_type:complete
MQAVFLAVLLLATTALAEDEPLLARIVDSTSERVPLHTIAPGYPRKARRDRIEGEVQVCFDIDRKGRTRRIAVRRSTNRLFERPSIRAVRASTFRALEDHQELPAIKSCRTFVFALQPVTQD